MAEQNLKTFFDHLVEKFKEDVKNPAVDSLAEFLDWASKHLKENRIAGVNYNVPGGLGLLMSDSTTVTLNPPKADTVKQAANMQIFKPS